MLEFAYLVGHTVTSIQVLNFSEGTTLLYTEWSYKILIRIVRVLDIVHTQHT